MTTHIEVAQALVDAGYLSDADIEAAVNILADALAVEEAEAAAAAAIDDMLDQEDLIVEAEAAAEEDSTAGDWDAVDVDEEIIDEAEEQAMADADIIDAAADTIGAAYADAAVSLLAAELIDEANAGAVAMVIADVWVVEPD